ncbi:MAG: site-specific integrase, partial [Limisphaerales bacterium]
MANDSATDGWAQKFLIHLATDRGASLYTQKNYRHALDEFSRWHARERQSPPAWDKLSRDDFRAYLRYLGRHNLSRAATALRFSALRTFFKFLARQGVAASSPVKNLSLPKPEKRLPKFLTVQQIEALLEAPQKQAQSRQGKKAGRPVSMTVALRDVAVLETIYSCGLRISELCGLRADDLDGAQQLVRVRGKGKKERLVPIGTPALNAIERYWKTLKMPPAGAAPVFFSETTR